MRIRLIGQANDSGIGTHFYHYTQAISQIAGINSCLEIIDYTDTAALQQAAQQSTNDDINISFVGSDLRYLRGHNINWTVFESTVIPQGLLNLYNISDIWLPSEWGRKIAIANGVDPNRIDVAVEGVDPNLFHPYRRIRDDSIFRFLIIGKYEVRKSYTETLEAFAELYGNNPKFELVIKSDFFMDQDIKRAELESKINSLGVDNIRLLWGVQSMETIAQLYRSSHAFVFASKAEGWGLPIIEAAACGIPLITTFYSAQTEFLQDIKSSCVFVPYTLEPIACPDYHRFYYRADGNYGLWAVPTKDSIKVSMMDCVARYPALAKQAVNNSEIIRSKWSWACSAIKSLEILRRRGLV